MKNEKGSGIRPGTFKRLMAYLFSHYRVQLITVILCIIITAVASVGQTVYIQILIDQCILPGVESGMASVWPQMRSIFTSMAVIYAVGVLASLIYTRITTSLPSCNFNFSDFFAFISLSSLENILSIMSM